MAYDDKGRRKWGGFSQDSRSNSKSDVGRSSTVMRGGASGRAPPRAIYTPGSGPLKKSDRWSEEFRDGVNPEDRSKPVSVQDRLRPPQFSGSACGTSHTVHQLQADPVVIGERVNNSRVDNRTNCVNETHDNSSHYGHADPRRRSKKPEQQLYVPKRVQEALAERDVANRSPVRRADTPPVMQEQHQQQQSGCHVGWDRERESSNRDWETQSNRSQRNDRNDRNERNDRNRNRGGRQNVAEARNNTSNRGRPDEHGKRYSGNRRNRNPNENEEREWRSKSPMSGRNYGNRRDYQREGSEPLSVTPNNANEYNRTRDTRSVDPPGYAEKFPRKPPSGRRGSGKLPCKIDTMPPRFQRKYLAENGLVDMPLGAHVMGFASNSLAKPSDDWDGSTVTFQGSSGYNNLSSMRNNYPSQSGWSNTVPARSRGRGRLRPEENEPSTGNFRPGTPDQYSAASSRSHTPSQENMTRSYERRGSSSTMYTSMESLSRADVPTAPARLISPAMSSHSNANRGGCQPSSTPEIQTRRAPSPINPAPMTYHHDQPGERANNNTEEATSSSEKSRNERYKSNRSPVKISEPCTSLPDMASIATLNWSEDVELELDLENENDSAQQENPSRSSSVMSLRDNGSVSERPGGLMGPPMGGGVGRHRGFKKKRRERRHSGAIDGDRSCSRDDVRRGKSRERMKNQQNRENETVRIDLNNSNRRYEPGRRHRNGKTLRSRDSSRERGDYRGVPTRHPDDSRRSADENWRTGKRTSICEMEDGRGSSTVQNIHQSHSGGGPLSNSDTNVVVVGRPVSPLARGTNFQGPGVLVLPEKNQISPRNATINPRGSPQQQQQLNSHSQMQQRKTLFDPNNPGKPIIVRATGNRGSLLPRDKEAQFSSGIPAYSPQPVSAGPLSFAGYHGPLLETGTIAGRPPATYVAEQIQGSSRPPWYEPTSGILHEAKDPRLLLEVETLDRELQWLLSSGGLIANWERISNIRELLKKNLRILLETDMKFCQAENAEQHFWKLLYYNMIEMLRKMMPKEACETRDVCKQLMLKIIDEGTSYFENLLVVLETKYKFKLDDFLVSALLPNGLGLVGLALVSAQKIFLFLGDLARYKEQANETTNYGKSRQWYLKAQQINPKNGRPYNQLALLAHYARRKLDAVYYYMRSLMASNPFHSARESLIALFDENRKKYESTERKRKEEREWKERARMKEKEGANNAPGALRRETWVHPGGRRVRRTTSSTTANDSKFVHSDSEELAQLTSVEVNKRFITSYLHVHGKLITKIGMETFQEAAIQMLREFRTLLQHSPLPIPETRLLQLLALNMFAIDTTQLKDSQMEQGYRSEVQERALVVSLQMFNLILERGVALLKSQSDENQRHRLIVNEDMQVLLPAIKIWCDWMLCHSTVWNPPPSCTDYRVGPPGDSWSRLATMVNLLEMLEYSRQIVIQAKDIAGRQNEVDLIKLPEDTTLSGFTPLMSNPQDPCYADKSEDMEVAQMCLRIQKILFFGEVFLCGLETPVLKLQKSESGLNEYVSVVEASSPSSPSSPPEQSDSELLVESDIDEEEDDAPGRLRSPSESWSGSQSSSAAPTTGEIRSLIERKGELERRQRKQERHRQQVQAILKKSTVSVDIEVRPRLLVPDTNCFIDYLPQLQSIARATSGTQPLYTLMIPLVVLNELEGLARGSDLRGCPPASRASLNPDHIARVGESAKAALAFARSRHPAIKCLTTRGTVLTSSTFTVEEDVAQDELTRNDDRILATCLSLCKSGNKDQQSSDECEPRRLKRDVVLLTEDRNLRVKALARDVPVREVPDFTQWAGLG